MLHKVYTRSSSKPDKDRDAPTYTARMNPFMYARIFRKAAHIRRFLISDTTSSSWEVREEQDTHVVRAVLYDDWHRVERAMMMFTQEARTLCESGWVEG